MVCPCCNPDKDLTPTFVAAPARMGRDGARRHHPRMVVLEKGVTNHHRASCIPVLFLQGQGEDFHVFSDASQHAYVGVVYIRTVYCDATASVSLVIAKTKVAPLTPSTIPRLELCSALLLSKLLQTVREDLSIQTDSKL